MLSPNTANVERRYFNCDDTEPEFRCSTPECSEASWNEHEFAKCEACARRFCPNHLVKFEDLLFCPDCARGACCGAPAVALCVECGELACEDHSFPRGLHARLCGHCKTDPDDLPAEAYDADDFRDNYSTRSL
jgi:hypothetical protein